MPRYIVKLPCDGDDYYLEWSSIVDAPVTGGMTLKEFHSYYKEQYGTEGLDRLPERMERVNESGTSDTINRRPVEDWLAYNRAGEGEACISVEEIIELYIRQVRGGEK